MAFRKKMGHIGPYKPDLLVVQECEHPSKFKDDVFVTQPNEFLWVGDNLNKGLGIMSFHDYHIAITRGYEPAYRYIVPITLSGPVRASLFAVWAMPSAHNRKDSYVGQVWNAMQHYRPMLKENTLIIGDLNSNTQFDQHRKIGNHTQLTQYLARFDIHSLYHQQTGEAHGQESMPTLYLLKNKDRPFHMDYCYASAGLTSNAASLEIGVREHWIKYSDHMPLLIEFY